MAECETCGDDVARLFEHRIRTESMTHRRTRRVCTSCHPSVPGSAQPDRSSGRLVADGGSHATCPVCSGTTVADGDSVVCVGCGWTGLRYPSTGP